MTSGMFNDSGSGSKRNATVIAVAIFVSLAIHFSLFVTLEDKSFGVFDPVVSAVRNAIRKVSPVKIVMPELPAPKKLSDPIASGAGLVGGGTTSSETLDKLSSVTPASIFDPPPVPKIELGSVMDKLAPPPAPELQPYQPRREIISIADATTRDLRAPIPRKEIPDIERQAIAPDITSSYNLLAGLDRAVANRGNILDGLYAPADVTFDSVEQDLPSSVDSKELPIPELGPESEGESAVQVVAEIPAEVAPARPLDDKLRITTQVYKPRRNSDPYTYFVIDVFRKDADSLPVIPHDILFVQDTSASLGERYLTPCRVALQNEIKKLGSGVRFNVMRFSTNTVSCFPGWAVPTADNVSKALGFVSEFRPAGNTDIFSSMQSVLSFPREEGRPVVVILLTDGFATTGKISRESRIIGEFSKLNSGDVSVFSIGVQNRSNAYLLDMLSFCNRGGGTEISPDRFSVDETVATVCAGVSRPTLSDIRFNFDTASGAVVLPRLTTNLYEDRPLRLYGRVPENVSSVAFQARGKSGGHKYDMLFEVDLNGAEARPGASDLAKQWAMQALYEMVAEHARTGNQLLLREMRELGAEYNLPVPYKSHIEGE